tara:strand:+ start:27 stop:710 length:684 start_codon:yes stop_codon:yes gene_type:complete
MSIRGNSGFIDIDKRFGSSSGDTKGIVAREQHFLERTQGRFAPISNTVTGSTQIGNGTTNNSFNPLYGLYDYSQSWSIFGQSEVGSAKVITGVAFQLVSWTSPYVVNNQILKMAHVSESSFTSSYPPTNLSDLTVSDLTTVLPSQTIGLVSGWQRFDFDTNFNFNGTDNLLLVWENRDGSWSSGYGASESESTGSKTNAYAFQDNSYPSGAYSTTSERPNIIIYYNE